MPMPEGSQLDFGFSPVLTNIGLNFLPKLDQFIGGMVFPNVPVASPDGQYNIWKQGDFLRRNGKRIANYEAVPLGGFATGTGNYSVVNWGVGTPYTARDLASARRRGMTDQAFKNAKVRWVVTQGVLEKEFRVKDLIQTTANWSTTIAGVTSNPNASQFLRWDQAAATPIDDVDSWKRKMRLLSGFTPNTMVIPEIVMLALKKNAQIQDRVKISLTGDNGRRPVEITYEHIKALLGIEKLLVPTAVYNSAAEGQADVLVEIWGQTMWLGYVSATPSSEDPSAGYDFSWTGNTGEGLPGGYTGEGPQNFGSVENDQGLFMREYVDNPRAARIIEGMLWTQPNVVAASLGMTWTAPIG